MQVLTFTWLFYIEWQIHICASNVPHAREPNNTRIITWIRREIRRHIERALRRLRDRITTNRPRLKRWYTRRKSAAVTTPRSVLAVRATPFALCEECNKSVIRGNVRGRYYGDARGCGTEIVLLANKQVTIPRKCYLCHRKTFFIAPLKRRARHNMHIYRGRERKITDLYS